MPARGEKDTHGIREHRRHDEVHGGEGQRLLAERKEHDWKPEVAAVREHHHEQERRAPGTIEAEWDGHQPREGAADGHDEHAEQRHAAEVERADRRHDHQVEHEARCECVENDARQCPDGNGETPGQEEADACHDEDWQDVGKEDCEEKLRRVDHSA